MLTFVRELLSEIELSIVVTATKATMPTTRRVKIIFPSIFIVRFGEKESGNNT
jgi:hypothetical protein